MEKKSCILARSIETGGKKFPKGIKGEIINSIENLGRTLLYVLFENEKNVVIVLPNDIMEE